MAAPVVTKRVQKILDYARQEAIRLQHQHIEPDHIALALIREQEGVAIAVLQQFHVDLDELSVKLEASLAARARSLSDASTVSYSSATERVLDVANADARAPLRANDVSVAVSRGWWTVESRPAVFQIMTDEPDFAGEFFALAVSLPIFVMLGRCVVKAGRRQG